MGKARGTFVVPRAFDHEGKRFASNVNESIAQLKGEIGNPLDAAVTFRDLIDTGLVKRDIRISGTGSVIGGDSTSVIIGDEEVLDTPPVPTGLSATGAFQNIVLDWDNKNFVGFSHAEIWAATSSNFADRSFVGQTTANVFNHQVGTNQTRYYWIRFVNTQGTPGPFNSTTGTSATTALIDTGDINDGAVSSIKILDGAILNAKIGTAAVDTAKIADAAITTAKIADANITNAKIADATITNAKINDLSADKINAGTISADRIGANTITADKINVTDLTLEFNAATVSGATIGSWQNNVMRLLKVADIGTEPGVYHIMCRVFGGNGQVKTLSIVAGDGTYGTGTGYELRNDFAYSDGPTPSIPTANEGYAQYHSGQSQYWSAIDRFDSTNEMVQKDFIVRKVSSTSRTLKLFILAQGDGNNRQLSNVQYGVYRFSEI